MENHFEERKLDILNVKIHKRTFESQFDASKNDDPITSKYMVSYKYAVSYDVKNYEHNPVVQCTRSKKDAEVFIEKLKKVHNVH
jgi:hypothetical protein